MSGIFSANAGPPAAATPIVFREGPALPSVLIQRLQAAHSWEAVRRASFHHRPCRDWFFSDKSASQWEHLARTVNGLQANPEMYVSIQWQTSATALLPNFMCTASAVKTYQTMAAEMPTRLQQHLVSQQLQLRTLVRQRQLLGIRDASPLAAAYAVLLDAVTELQPLFRLCMMSRFGDMVQYAAILPEALSQYVAMRPAYDVSWDVLLPFGLDLDADAYIKERMRCRLE